MSKDRCRWLRMTEVSGWVGDAGLILGNCDLLGGTAYETRCEMCTAKEVRR